MYRQPSNRRLLVQRIAVYAVMVLATLGLVIVLIFILLGYQFNRNDGRIEQGGLVQFESRPTGAEVIIDGNKFNARTNSKTTLVAGPHTIKMQRDDYRTWQKTVDVVKGTVLWLNYARLIPKQITPTTAASLTGVSGTAVSPDSKWMAIKEDASTPIIRLADLTQDDLILTTLTLPASSYTAPAADKSQSFGIEKWDPTSHTMLVRHAFNDSQVEWLVVDSQNVANTKNLTTLLGIQASKVVFSRSTNIVYAVVDGAVRKVDLDAKTLSGPLVSGVTDVSLYDQSILVYVTAIDPATGKRTVGYVDDGNSKSHTLRSFADDGTPPLRVQLGKYLNQTYVAIAYGKNFDVLIGELPRSDENDAAKTMTATASVKLPGDVQFLSIKNNGRFVVAQAGATYTVYDHELHKTTAATLKDMPTVTKEIEWLDDYMQFGDGGGVLRTYEFDGTNQQDIMPVTPGFSAAISQGGKYIYGIMKAADGNSYNLERARLLL